MESVFASQEVHNLTLIAALRPNNRTGVFKTQDMKCMVCKIRESEKNSIVCSDSCDEIRLAILQLYYKYTPSKGCDNCWGDLGGNCTDECREESRRAHRFINELYKLVRLSLNRGSMCKEEVKILATEAMDLGMGLMQCKLNGWPCKSDRAVVDDYLKTKGF